MQNFQTIETLRLQYSKKIVKKMTILLILLAILNVIIVILIDSSLSFMHFLIGIIFNAVIYILMIKLITKKEYLAFKKIYKEEIIAKQLREIFSDVHYDYEGLHETVFKESHLYNQYTQYYSSDSLQAKYQGKSFQSADVLIQRVVSTGKTSYTETIFKGLFFIFDIERKTNYCTQVYPRGKCGYVKGLFSSDIETNKIKFESEEFNRAFNVYCEDGTEAFYVLTPRIMEILLTLQTKLDFSCSFVDNKLYIAVENEEDFFEMNLFKPIDQERYKEQLNASKRIGEIILAISKIQWN